jgi:GWxTD domain-containing protein
MGDARVSGKCEAFSDRSSAFTRAAALAAALLAVVIVPHVPAQSAAGQSLAADGTASQLAGPYLTWVDQDVHWIIAPDERQAYLGLQSNAERMQFIKGFWERRNADPAGGENTFKEEHYRRLAYANVHFAGTHAGWTTHRGHIYIVYGAPDSIDAHPSGEAGDLTPFEVWHYRSLQGRGSVSGQAGAQGEGSGGVDFRFVDACKCGDYKLAVPAAE